MIPDNSSVKPSGSISGQTYDRSVVPALSTSSQISRAKILDVLFAYNNASAFTDAGYYGEAVEVAIGRLLHATNENVDARACSSHC